MKLPWNRSRRNRRALVGAAFALGIAVLALPLVPSLRRYMVMESM